MAARVWVDDAERVLERTSARSRSREVRTVAPGASLHPSCGRLIAILVHVEEFVEAIGKGGAYPHRAITQDNLSLALQSASIFGHLADHRHHVPVFYALPV